MRFWNRLLYVGVAGAMTYLNHFQSASRGVPPLIYCSLILVLLSYVSIDIVLHKAEYSFGLCTLEADALHLRQGKLTGERAQAVRTKWREREDKYCSSIKGHLPQPPSRWRLLPERDPWNQMKWVGRPARCKVKGQLIESLDDTYNFRRGYALKYVGDVEDKTHLLPWLLGNRVNLNLRERRVYLDLGANALQTSIQWFMRMYPCDFTEVHAFEINAALLRFPEVPFQEDGNKLEEENPGAVVVKETPGIPAWQLNRMKFYNALVSDADGEGETKAVNITRFMKESLKLSAADTVVVKMDIEGSEWEILERWLDDPEMVDIVDELFVEIHYDHPTMKSFWFDFFQNRTREQATHLLAGMRQKGFFVHAWP